MTTREYRALWAAANLSAWPWVTSSNSGLTSLPSSAPSSQVRFAPYYQTCPSIANTSGDPQDQYLGKFKTVIASTPIYVIGMVVLVATSAPVALRANAGMGGLITAMITIGLGTGGLKACIAPMCAEQNPDTEAHVKTTKSGERVVVDPNLTSARVFMWLVLESLGGAGL